MLRYRKDLKKPARKLRANATDAEKFLWQKLRGKQICGLQFYRQKALLSYIVDFYCPMAKLVIELDGSQHLQRPNLSEDADRDAALAAVGLTILRFDNRQVFLETESVLTVIYELLVERLGGK